MAQIVKDLRKGDLHSGAKGSYADRKLLVFSTHEVKLATLKGRVKLSPKNRQLKGAMTPAGHEQSFEMRP